MLLEKYSEKILSMGGIEKTKFEKLDRDFVVYIKYVDIF